MYKTIKTKIIGQAPLILHNARMADPATSFVRELKKITDKGTKNMTDADYLEKSRLQFFGSLYMGPNGPIIPAHMVEGMLIAGAKQSRKGKNAKSGIVVRKHADIIYDGPKDAEGLFAVDDHRLSAMVKIGRGLVTSTRPIFPEWSADLEIDYLTERLNDADIYTFLRDAGSYCGIGDWRPRNGRFALAVDVVASLKQAA